MIPLNTKVSYRNKSAEVTRVLGTWSSTTISAQGYIVHLWDGQQIIRHVYVHLQGVEWVAVFPQKVSKARVAA